MHVKWWRFLQYFVLDHSAEAFASSHWRKGSQTDTCISIRESEPACVPHSVWYDIISYSRNNKPILQFLVWLDKGSKSQYSAPKTKSLRYLNVFSKKKNKIIFAYKFFVNTVGYYIFILNILINDYLYYLWIRESFYMIPAPVWLSNHVEQHT